MHYVLDLWFERRFNKTCQGYAGLTRFADRLCSHVSVPLGRQAIRHEMEVREHKCPFRWPGTETVESTAVMVSVPVDKMDGPFLWRRRRVSLDLYGSCINWLDRARSANNPESIA